MLRKLCIALGLLVATPAIGQNVQPISVSMTDCHVLLGYFADNASARRTEAEVAKMRTLSDDFAIAAVAQARAEGRDDPEAWVVGHRERLTPKWESQVGNVFKLPDTLEWVRYCTALGKNRGLID